MLGNQFSPFHFSHPASKNSQARKTRRLKGAIQSPARSRLSCSRFKTDNAFVCMGLILRLVVKKVEAVQVLPMTAVRHRSTALAVGAVHRAGVSRLCLRGREDQCCVTCLRPYTLGYRAIPV